MLKPISFFLAHFLLFTLVLFFKIIKIVFE